MMRQEGPSEVEKRMAAVGNKQCTCETFPAKYCPIHKAPPMQGDSEIEAMKPEDVLLAILTASSRDYQAQIIENHLTDAREQGYQAGFTDGLSHPCQQARREENEAIARYLDGLGVALVDASEIAAAIRSRMDKS